MCHVQVTTRDDCKMCQETEYLTWSVVSNTDNITCRQWITTDRATLGTAQSCADFLKYFAKKLNILIHPYFRAWQQSCFYTEMKLKLKLEKILTFPKTTTSSYKMKYKVFIGTMLGICGLLLKKLNGTARQCCCYQWKGILWHHWETRDQTLQTIHDYSYKEI
jgi:hypothetical protein